VLTKVIGDVKRFGRLTLHEHILEVDLLGASNNFLKLLAAKLDMAVAKLVLSCWLSLELFLDNTVVSLLLASTHAIKIASCWLILANGLLYIERINLLNEFKGWLSDSCVHTKVQVFLHLLESHRRRSLRLLNLLCDSVVFLAVKALVLDQVIEAMLIGFDAEIIFDILLFFLKLMLIKSAQYLVRLLAFLVLQAIDLRHVGLIVISSTPLRFEVFQLSCGAAKNLVLATECVRGAREFNRSLIGALKNLKTHLRVEVSQVLWLKRDVDVVLCVGQQLTTRWCRSELSHLREVEVQG